MALKVVSAMSHQIRPGLSDVLSGKSTPARVHSADWLHPHVSLNALC